MLPHMVKLWKFALVGCLVLVLDALMFTAFMQFGLRPNVARIASVFLAMICSWILNRVFTFKAGKPGRNFMIECAAFMLSQLPGAVMNAVVSLWAFHHIAIAAMYPLIAVFLGSCAGLLLNYLLASRYIFKH